MKLNRKRVQKYLKNFDFESLFIEELFWDTVDISLPLILIDETSYSLQAIAQKRGLIIYAYLTENEPIPCQKIRQQIDTEVTQYTREHLIIYGCLKLGQQVWQWIKREGEKRPILKETHFNIKQSGELLIQKLEKIAVGLEEEETINLSEITQRVKQGFDIDKVTKEFFGKFQEKHLQLVSFIEGIDNNKDASWYASVILNRLMFIYFLQKKGFLDDGNTDYLQDKLDESEQKGKDLYYKRFLKTLFFEGFGKREAFRSDTVNQLIGEIKYLNGGLFLPHTIEVKYQDNIKIADQGFREIFSLFSAYTWHLDDRPTGKDDEINPDVLGYIFEKYINQKEFGAYYTRPEITEYLCQRTIDKFILTRASTLLVSFKKQDACVTDNLDNNLCNLLLDDILPNLSILDPACGSAAFLVAALKHLIGIYTKIFEYIKQQGDKENKSRLQDILNRHPSLEYYIKKRIITDNLYGVDIMEEATEIAKLRLFLSLVASAKTVEDLEPLPNVDFNIMAGNSLIGLIGVDGNAFNSIKEAGGKKSQEVIQGSLLSQLAASEYEGILKEKNESIRKYKEHAFLQGEVQGTSQGDRLQMLRDHIEQVNRESMVKLNQLLLDEFSKKLGIKYHEVQLKGKPKKRVLNVADIEALKPFHWGYHFDEIINQGGFDIIITNPPWEIFKPQAKEFFAQYSDLVTKNKMDIKTFQKQQKKLLADSEVANAWLDYQSQYPHVSLYYRSAEQYINQISVVNGRKQGTDINLYKLFLEQCVNLLSKNGECGIVIPSGIYTDLGCKQLREMLFSQTKVTGLFCFENRKAIFEGVDSRFKFVILTFENNNQTVAFPAKFMRHEVEELNQFPDDSSINIEVDLVKQLSPDSLSVMEFRQQTDLKIMAKLYKFPFLSNDNQGWNLEIYGEELHMNRSTNYFKTNPTKSPLYEGRMIWHFNHNYSEPRYWIEESELREDFLEKRMKRIKNNCENKDWKKPHDLQNDYECYRLAIRKISASTNERTLVTTIIPKYSFTGNSIAVHFPLKNHISKSYELSLSHFELLIVTSLLNSFVLDYAIRSRITTNLNTFYLYQLPVPRLTEKDAYFNEIVERSAKLICTTPEYDELAKEVGLGSHKNGVTRETERAKLRAELDGMIAHLYGLTEAEFSHILSTFPIVDDKIKEDALEAYRKIMILL
ncbi:MAG: ATP-binding protein [Crocosphaera sp.]|nr:ATP-binding protein [Crocosphaera sp.]